MRIDSPENAKRRKSRKQTRQEKKSQQSILEKELFSIMEKSMEAALD